MKRDWAPAREKVDAEGICRICAKPYPEAAHTWHRGRGGSMDADLIVPLCGPPTSSSSCHGRFDAHRLDILHVLTLDEQVALVRVAGGIEQARIRACPSLYR